MPYFESSSTFAAMPDRRASVASLIFQAMQFLPKGEESFARISMDFYLDVRLGNPVQACNFAALSHAAMQFLADRSFAPIANQVGKKFRALLSA